MDHEEHDKATKTNIEKAIRDFGWFVAKFEADTACPAMGYTIGLWETFKHPEIICFGLSTNLMHQLLNDAGEKIAQGKTIKTDIDDNYYLEKSPVMFKNIEPENINDYMGYGRWYYKYNDFQAIQLFWTDKQGKYPWQNEYSIDFQFRQPLLYKILDFKFFEPQNVASFTTKQILLEGKPILRVIHDDDEGAWQFFPGENVTIADAMLVSLSSVVNHDPTVNELFNMPTGQYATRAFIGDKWVRYKANESGRLSPKNTHL
jgi:hypothetical protein